MALRWGVDIDAQLQDWWRDVYLPGPFRRQYGKDARIMVEVFDTSIPIWQWDLNKIPLMHVLVTGLTEKDADFFGSEGLHENIQRKFPVMLRSGLNSYVLEDERLDLVEPGDFPWEGAGEYRDYMGGASGLPGGAKDWQVFKDVVTQLIVLRADAARPAVALVASDNTPEGWKYLPNEVPPTLP